MISDVATFSSPLALAVLSSWCFYIFSRRQSAESEARTRRLAAAADLGQALRDFQGLLRRHGRVPVRQDEVSAAIARWGQALDRQQHRLPDDLQHVRRSVLDAVGTVFGAVALTHVRPDTAEFPIAEPDYVWQDFGDDYLDCVIDALLRWGDSQRRRKLPRFDPWLAETGRRPPLG